MKIKADIDGFAKWSEDMTHTFHTWEVVMPVKLQGKLKLRQATFSPEDYETAEEQYEDVCAFVNDCRFSNTDYSVFCDGKLVWDF